LTRTSQVVKFLTTCLVSGLRRARSRKCVRDPPLSSNRSLTDGCSGRRGRQTGSRHE
jgi:hypothetical protein